MHDALFNKFFSDTGAVEEVTHLVLSHVVNRSTTYILKNNSDYKVDTLYIEHKAGSEHNGFVIKTQTDQKSVTGFSRFALALAEHSEEIFKVDEEAQYEERLPVSRTALLSSGHQSGVLRLERFLKERVKNLSQQGTLSANQKKFIKLKLLEAEKRQLLLDLKSSPARDEAYLRKLEKKPEVCSPKSELFKLLAKLISQKADLSTVEEKVRLGESLKANMTGGINKNIESLSKRKQEEATLKSKLASSKFDLQTLATNLLEKEREGKDIKSLGF